MSSSPAVEADVSFFLAELNKGVSLLCQQFRAMFKKRFLHSIRDKKAIGLQLLLPVLMVLLGLILYDSGFTITDDPSRKLTLSNLASSGLSVETFFADFSRSSNSSFYKVRWVVMCILGNS